MPCIAATDLIRPFIKAGLVPDNCCRIVFDFRVNNVVRILYECFADTAQIEAIMPTLLEAGELVKREKEETPS